MAEKSKTSPAAFCLCLPFILIIVGGYMFETDRSKENNYVEDTCFVLNGQILTEICGDSDARLEAYTLNSKNITLTNSSRINSQDTCYQPLWTVTYNYDKFLILNITKQAVILGSYSILRNNAIKEFSQYPVSVIKLPFLY